MTSVVFVESSAGEDWGVWAAIIVAVASLAITLYWNIRAERRTYLDEYWFRIIIAPRCIDPVISLHEKWMTRIENMGQSSNSLAAFSNALNDFQKEKMTVLESAWISGVFSKSYYQRCCEALDAAEDVLAQEFSNARMQGSGYPGFDKSLAKKAITDASRKIIAAAAKMHGGSLRPL